MKKLSCCSGGAPGGGCLGLSGSPGSVSLTSMVSCLWIVSAMCFANMYSSWFSGMSSILLPLYSARMAHLDCNNAAKRRATAQELADGGIDGGNGPGKTRARFGPGGEGAYSK